MKNILLRYIGYNKKGIVLFIVCSLVFASIFYLYNANINAVIYSVSLCSVVMLVFLIWDFGSFYNKHKALNKLQSQIMVDIKKLPSSDNLIEEDYDRLIRVLYEDRIRLIFDMDREKSDMLDYYTLWAHQIKTPIAAMNLLLQVDDTQNSKVLLSELFKVEQYANMALSYLRLESSYTDFVIKEYSLEDIIRQAVRKYAPLFIRKKIAVKLRDLDISVLTDEKWLVFVVEQLLSNALKYTNSGMVSIYTKDRALVIEDTGIGIEAEDVFRLGEKGFTGYNGRYHNKATGLGLYLCKQTLEKLCHNMKIESKVGLYTRVIIEFGENKLVKD